MKKIYYITLLIALTSFLVINAQGNANSLAFSGSYMLRSQGTDCIYWNPNNLSGKFLYDKFQINTPLNLYFGAHNSDFSIGLYNDLNGNYISEKLKDDLYKEIENNIKFQGNLSVNLIEIAYRNWGFACGVNNYFYGKISEKYLKLLLSGNEEEEYFFTDKNNSLSAVSFFNFTLSNSNYYLSDYITSLSKTEIPAIKIGWRLDFLLGNAYGNTETFDGSFSTSIDSGTSFEQIVKIKEGQGGYGLKANIFFTSQINDQLEVGLACKNIVGFINWIKTTKLRTYEIEMDSVYIADLQEDFYNTADYTEYIDDFETIIPFTLHLSGLYHYKEKHSFSLDWKQAFKQTVYSSKYPEISFGYEYKFRKYLPLRTGFNFGNPNHNFKFSLGTAFLTKITETSIAIQSTNHVIPCNLSHGFAFAFNFKLNF